MKKISILIISCILFGCAAHGTLYTDKPHKDEIARDKSRVYVYRIKQFKGSGGATHFLDNGRDMGAINVGGYITFLTEPGAHKVHTSTMGIDKPLEVNMKPGKAYYFRVDYDPGMWTGTFSVKPMSAFEAIPEISLTRYQGE